MLVHALRMVGFSKKKKEKRVRTGVLILEWQFCYSEPYPVLSDKAAENKTEAFCWRQGDPKSPSFSMFMSD